MLALCSWKYSLKYLLFFLPWNVVSLHLFTAKRFTGKTNCRFFHGNFQFVASFACFTIPVNFINFLFFFHIFFHSVGVSIFVLNINNVDIFFTNHSKHKTKGHWILKQRAPFWIDKSACDCIFCTFIVLVLWDSLFLYVYL